MTEWYNRTAQPRFERPPVVEAVLSLEWASLPGLGSYQLGRMQDQWATQYPNVQDVPGAPPSQLVQPLQGPSFQFQMGGVPPARIWASNEETGLLVQTQADRLVLNWRDDQGQRLYPGYDFLRAEFERLWGLLRAYLESSGLPSPTPVLAQYTYLNLVDLDSDDTMASVVAVIQEPAQTLPGKELITRFQFVRDVNKNSEHPMAAQIIVTGEPQTFEGGRRIALNVDTRAIFDGAQPDVLSGIDVAHALSSYTFDRIISAAKRAEWGEM